MTRLSGFARPLANSSCYLRPLPSARAGFSLVELLVVIAIMVIVVTLFWGSDSSRKERARVNACRANLEKIFMAMEIYSGEFNARFPARQNAQTSETALTLLVPRYTVDTATFICPASKDSAPPPDQPLDKATISYAYYMGRIASPSPEPLLTDEQLNCDSKATGEAAFSESGKPPGNNHASSGGNVLFSDGRVETIPARLPFSLVLTQGVVLLNPKP